MFSTVHTNDAAGAVTRLVDMGVEPFLVASSLTARAGPAPGAPRVPATAAVPYTPTDEELKELGLTRERFKRATAATRIYKADGLRRLQPHGYRGRTGIYELLLVDDDIRQLVLKNVDSGTIKKKAAREGDAHAARRRRPQGRRWARPPSPRSSASPRRTSTAESPCRSSNTEASTRPASRSTGLREADIAQERCARCCARTASSSPTCWARPRAAGRAARGARERRRRRASLPTRRATCGKLARGRVSTDDIAIITRQLATLLGAGRRRWSSRSPRWWTRSEKERLKRDPLRREAAGERGLLAGGRAAGSTRNFGTLYVNMVRAGEHSGALDAVLLRLADFTEGQASCSQKIIGTMIYPAIMVVIGGGILVLLMTVVVPKVTKIFDDMKATLPWTTRLLICHSATSCRTTGSSSSRW